MADRVSIEIWDHVASFVAEPPDLLHVAMTSSRFRALIIPAHLHYCAVSTDVYNDAFWSDLSLKRAGRLRELNFAGFNIIDFIYSEGFGPHDQVGLYTNARFPRSTRCIVPLTTSEESLCLECTDTITPSWVASMAKCASAMSGLRKVAMHLTICDVARMSRCNFFTMFDPPLLKTFKLSLSCCSETVDEDRMKEALTGLQKLKGGYVSFSFDCTLGEQANRRVMAVIMPMMGGNCRDLRHLDIQISHTDFSDIDVEWASFWCATWPRLQTLSLKSIRIAAGESEAVSGFLRRHRLIEILRIQRLYQEPLYLDFYESLPYVREVAIDALQLASVQCLLEQYDTGSYRSIESLCFQAHGSTGCILEAVDAICQHGARAGTLRRLEFATYSDLQPNTRIWLRMIAQSNPRLRELTADPSEVCADDMEWNELLPWFPNLEVLHGYQEDCWVVYPGEDEDEDVDIPDIADIIQEQQARLPKLRQFGNWVKESDNIWKWGRSELQIDAAVTTTRLSE